MQFPPAGLKSQNKDATGQGGWVHAVSSMKAVHVVGMLTIIAVAGAVIIWGQSSKGPMGDQGPPGAKVQGAMQAHRASHRAFG